LADLDRWLNHAVLGPLLDSYSEEVRLSAVKTKQVPEGHLPALQRNSARAKDFTRKIPRPITITPRINGQSVRALLDSGSLGDFMSSALADQLQVKKFALEKPISVQLAVQGSRTKVNYGCKVKFEYAKISTERYFDIVNVDGYDLILGTPFLFQHQVVMGFNDTRVLVGSDSALPVQGESVTVLSSRAADVQDATLEQARQELRAYAAPLCKKAADTTLPPLRKSNHRVPIIDPGKRYHFRPSRCPEAFRELWNTKRDQYIKSGRWRFATGSNAAPMMFLKKHTAPGEPLKMRNTIDLRERNANTSKIASPLPDQRTILYRVASHAYISCVDGQDAYEQIRVEPSDVKNTLVNTPDGTIESLVMQQGDCNAVATFMTVMVDMFSPYLGKWMDIYLDDIVIYTNTLEEHIKCCKIVIDTFDREQFYLAEHKLQFLPRILKLLGRRITRDGIQMDPEKVDSVLAWKTPTNRDLLRGFIGSVGYLADDVEAVRIPMDVLNRLTGDTVAFRWGPTEQRAFEQVKQLVEDHRDKHRVAMKHGAGTEPVNVVTDGCISGIAGKISQGPDWKSAPVVAFYSAKLSPAQQNYIVTEIEMLAGLETMMRHRDLLLGVPFTWYTDHRALEHLLTQRNLSPRQARWVAKLSEFDFKIQYVPGKQNILADALSRMYSADTPGTVRSPNEYAQHDDTSPAISLGAVSQVVKSGSEAKATMNKSSRPAPVTERVLRPRKPLPEVIKPKVPAPKAPRKKAPVPAEVPVPTPAAKDLAPETGRPETSKEFAKCIKKVVLNVPDARLEDGSSTSVNDTDHHTAPPEPVDSTRKPEPTTLVSTIPPTDGISFADSIRHHYQVDKFFKRVLEKPSDYKNFSVEQGLVFISDGGRERLCIPDCKIGERSAREIAIRHAHSLLAHLGITRTLSYLRDHVWWKSMVTDTAAYVDSCATCKRSKPNNQKPYGLLNPLAVPSTPWEAVGIDFVGPLTPSRNRDAEYNCIVTIIDLLTGTVHLVPGRTTYRAKDIAELVFAEIYKRYGLPSRFISDRDKWFTSTFWKRLHELIGIELQLSSAYHPETDGSTERANRTLGVMLTACVKPDQSDWVARLPAIEFAINSARSESTGFAPFFLNMGRMPRSMIWNRPTAEEYPSVRVMAQRTKQAIMAAHDSILQARVKQVRAANRLRRPSPFAEEDLVYVSTKNIDFPKGRNRKMTVKYIGPYKIIKDFGNNSYKLELPDRLRARGLHDVFHLSLLRVHVPNDDRLFPGRLETQVADFGDIESSEWVVSSIASHVGSGRTATFEVIWKAGDRTWLEYDRVKALPIFNEYLELQGTESIDTLSVGTGQPPDDDPQVFAGSTSYVDDILLIYERAEGGTGHSSPAAHSTLLRLSAMSATTLDATAAAVTDAPALDAPAPEPVIPEAAKVADATEAPLEAPAALAEATAQAPAEAEPDASGDATSGSAPAPDAPAASTAPAPDELPFAADTPGKDTEGAPADDPPAEGAAMDITEETPEVTVCAPAAPRTIVPDAPVQPALFITPADAPAAPVRGSLEAKMRRAHIALSTIEGEKRVLFGNEQWVTSKNAPAVLKTTSNNWKTFKSSCSIDGRLRRQHALAKVSRMTTRASATSCSRCNGTCAPTPTLCSAACASLSFAASTSCALLANARSTSSSRAR
jgi:hypothetical protein